MTPDRYDRKGEHGRDKKIKKWREEANYAASPAILFNYKKVRRLYRYHCSRPGGRQLHARDSSPKEKEASRVQRLRRIFDKDAAR